MRQAIESQRLAAYGDGAGPLSTLDRREALPYRGRVILVFGGSSGTGEQAVNEFLNLGADWVYMGTRSDARFTTTQGRLSNLLDADVSRLRPFVADVADPNQVEAAVRRMKQDGVSPTNVFFFQAAGIEEFAKQLQTHLDHLLSIHERNLPDRDEQASIGIQNLNADLAVWLANEEYREHARAVNFTGPRDAIGILASEFDSGFDVVDINSTFGHLGEGPGFYRNVLSKYEMSQWLKENAETLKLQEITSAEVVAPVIADTGVGRIIVRRILPHYPPDIRDLIADTLVERTDVVHAARQHIELPLNERMAIPGLDVRYVMREGGKVENGRGIVGPDLIVTSQMPSKMRIDVARLPF